MEEAPPRHVMEVVVGDMGWGWSVAGDGRSAKGQRWWLVTWDRGGRWWLVLGGSSWCQEVMVGDMGWRWLVTWDGGG